jgi:hypothetical protein
MLFKAIEPEGRSPGQLQPYVPPIWTGPSEFTMARLIPINEVVARTDRAAILLVAVASYANGFDLAFEVKGRVPLSRGAIASDTAPWDLTTGPNRLRFGFVFSDGRAAGGEPTDIWNMPKDEQGLPYTPVILLRGVQMGLHTFDVRAWGWPLPPPGKLMVHAAWGALGVQEHSLELDADVILDAATQTSELW